MNEIKERQTTLADKLRKRASEAQMLSKKQFDEILIILVDVSGSMSGACENGQSKLENVKQSVVYLTSPQNYISYGLIAFDSSATPIQPPTTNFGIIVSQGETLMARGMTNYSSAIREALEMIGDKQSEKRRIILMTDGCDNTDTHQRAGLIERCIRDRVVIDTIGFGQEANEGLLMEISRLTGGVYQKALSPLQLAQAYQKLNYQVRWIEHKNGGNNDSL